MDHGIDPKTFVSNQIKKFYLKSVHCAKMHDIDTLTILNLE